MRLQGLFFALVVSQTALTADLERADGRELIGNRAPAINLKLWLNSGPLEVSDLHGKVVLIRWWTDTCDLCAATAPALRELRDEHGLEGLKVIGIFHPKPPGDKSLDRMERAASRYQFTFPVALDADWSALKRWWLNVPRDYTSVSFVLDKNGIIRYVHPGGEYHPSDSPQHQSCNRDFHAIEAEIGRLLAE